VNHETLHEKIRALRKMRGWSQKDLAQRAGLSVGAISEIERGLYQFHRRSTLEKIARAFGLTPDELTGVDAKYLQPSSGATFPLYGGGVDATLSYYGKGVTKSYGGRVPFKPAPGVPVPLWDRETLIALLDKEDGKEEREPAGLIAVSLFATDKYLGMPEPKGLFALEMEDESMYPTLHTGDLLLLMLERRQRFGPILLVRTGKDEPLIRRLKPSEGKILLVPDNPAMKPEEFEPEQVKVHGVVLGIIMRKLL